ncbi:MAG: hypothetical protein VKL20_06750, partial [Synechocystis sp.]|nr:hypothetical protein [Synechocystis sp.]
RIPDPDRQASVIKDIAVAYAEAGKDYQSVLNQIEDSQLRLLATIEFHLKMADGILIKKN